MLGGIGSVIKSLIKILIKERGKFTHFRDSCREWKGSF